MKIYTQTFDISRPAPHRFWVSPHSDFKIGIKLVNAGVELENDFTVAAGTTELIADEEKVDGFTIFTLNSTDTGFVEYTISIDGLVQKLKLVQIITDSTVFDIDERNGDMSQYATKNWVEGEISGFVEEADLTAYATKNWVEGEISGFVEDADLTAYVTVDELSSYVEASSLTAYATVDELSNYAEASALTAYYTKSETSSAAELSNAFQSKVTGGAETGTTGTPAAVNAVKSVFETDWAALSATADANTFYVVLPDPA